MDSKGAYLSLLDEVVNTRYERLRPTVLTTNIDAQRFRARYGERITDRLNERSGFVVLAGGSLRGEQR
jgi:DNA replication protein DnaC